MAASQEEARALLQQYLRVLATKPNKHTGDLCVRGNGRAASGKGCFYSKQTSISANVTTANAKPLRAFIEIVGQLSQSSGFQWRECYHSFWKSALMTPFACSSCSVSVGGQNPRTTEFDSFELLMQSDGPRFFLDFSEAKSDVKQIELLQDFFFQDPRHALVAKNVKLLTKLTQQGRPASAVQTDRDLGAKRIELCIKLSRYTSSSELRALVALLDDYIERDGQSSGGDPNQNAAVRFKVTTLWVPFEKLLLPVEIDLLIDIIASETSMIKHLYLDNVCKMLLLTERLEIFQQLLRTTVCVFSDSNVPRLQTLHLMNVPTKQPPAKFICSALRYRSSLKDLHLQWPFPVISRKEKVKSIWAWIAFGIFHPDSDAKLDRLNLSGLPLSAEDMTTFASILRSPHPGRALWMLEDGDFPQGEGCGEVPMPAGQRVFVQLKVGTEMRVSLRARAYDHYLMESEEFEVAIMLASWICVVVAGMGCAGSQPDEWPLAGANVKAFDRGLWDKGDQFEDIKLLLRMIGHCLDGFSFSDHKAHITNADLRDILNSCPKLTHLDLTGNSLTEIGALVDKFEKQQCRIAFLSVFSTWRHHLLLSQLSDLLASPFSKPLKYVGVSGRVESDHQWGKLEHALNVNKSLQILFLYKPNGKHSPLLRKMQAQFGQETTISSLPIDAKVAFLSVIKSQPRSTPRSTSLRKLDSKIASEIFAFAGMQSPRIMFW